MGKAGNKARREAKKAKEAMRTAGFSTLDENIQQVLLEDELAEWRDSIREPTKEEYEANMAKILGPPGPPKDDNVVWLGLPSPQKKTTRKVVDCLGRVVEVDETPPLLKRIENMAAKTGTLSPTPKHDVIIPPAEKRRVTLMRDTALTFPELYIEVFVQPDPAVRDDEARFAQMFARSRCTRAKSVLEADLVVFGGGSDVDPVLYGELPHETTFCDPKRDATDMALYLLCLEHGIPMFGVCRGAQFLHVMNGGKLWQDVDNHYGDHKMFDVKNKAFIDKVSSVHHQMVRPNRDNGMEILGTSPAARKRWASPGVSGHGAKADIEAFFYRDTCCLGVQGHPEYANYSYFTKWCLEQIESLIFTSPDIEWRDGTRRIKTELLEERKLVAKAKANKETN